MKTFIVQGDDGRLQVTGYNSRKLVVPERSNIPHGHSVTVTDVVRDTNPADPRRGVLFVRVSHDTSCDRCRAERGAKAWAAAIEAGLPVDIIHELASWKKGVVNPSVHARCPKANVSVEALLAWAAPYVAAKAELAVAAANTAALNTNLVWKKLGVVKTETIEAGKALLQPL